MRDLRSLLRDSRRSYFSMNFTPQTEQWISILPPRKLNYFSDLACFFSEIPVLNEDENSPNDNSQTEYTSTSEAELVKSEAAAGGSNNNTSADPLAITSNTEEQLDRSAGSAGGGAGAAAVTPSVDAYAMQRYNNYDSNYAASQYVQSYYGAATAGGAGYPHMTGLSAPFLYPHLYSAGHHASSVQHGHGGESVIEDYNNPEARAAGGADGTGVPAGEQHSGQHTGYSQIGEDESQTGPIRGGYLKSEHGVWRPYWKNWNEHFLIIFPP